MFSVKISSVKGILISVNCARGNLQFWAFRNVDFKIKSSAVNARIKNVTKDFCDGSVCHVERSETSLADFGHDNQVPHAGDSGPEIGIFFAVTVERAASERAMVGLSGRSRRRTRRGHEDGECGDDASQDIFSVFHISFFFLVLALQRKFGADAEYRTAAMYSA
jgi:hypothetical protein